MPVEASLGECQYFVGMELVSVEPKSLPRHRQLPCHAHLEMLRLSCLQIHGEIWDIDFGTCFVTELADDGG